MQNLSSMPNATFQTRIYSAKIDVSPVAELRALITLTTLIEWRALTILTTLIELRALTILTTLICMLEAAIFWSSVFCCCTLWSLPFSGTVCLTTGSCCWCCCWDCSFCSSCRFCSRDDRRGEVGGVARCLTSSCDRAGCRGVLVDDDTDWLLFPLSSSACNSHTMQLSNHFAKETFVHRFWNWNNFPIISETITNNFLLCLFMWF